METGNVGSLHASSTDLIRLLESFRLTDYEDRVQSVFAENLLSYSQCNKIVDDINQQEKLFYEKIYPVKQVMQSQNQFTFLKLKFVICKARLKSMKRYVGE